MIDDSNGLHGYKIPMSDGNMETLGTPDSHHLRAAMGWFEAGRHLDAHTELEKISPEKRIHPDVLQMRWHLHSQTERWDACLETASAQIKHFPNRPEGWIHQSIALHNLNRTGEAFVALLAVCEKFPANWKVPYNLACFCVRLRRPEEAKSWLRQAMQIDQDSVRLAGRIDPDLKPLWNDAF